MEDSRQILRCSPIVERHQFQKRVERQRCQWQRRAIVDRGGDGTWDDVAKTGHVEDDAFLQLKTTFWRDGLAERKHVHQTAGTVLDPMRQARANEAVIGESILERLEVAEARHDDGDVSIVGHPRRASIQE